MKQNEIPQLPGRRDFLRKAFVLLPAATLGAYGTSPTASQQSQEVAGTCQG